MTGNERSDSDYDVLVVPADRVGQKERLRLAGRCRLRLAQEGCDGDVLVTSPQEISDYGDKRERIVHEAPSTGVQP